MIAKLQQLRLSALFHFRRGVMRAPVKVHHVRNPFHAVSIVLDKRCACAAAQEVAGKRYLASEAPRLPLLTCNQAVCTCRYQHHADRREDSRRASDGKWGPPARVYTGAERRSGGRRIDD